MHYRTLSCLAATIVLSTLAVGQELLDRPQQLNTTNQNVRESYETADFKRVVTRVEELAAKYSGEQVLVVVDIDNTLLAMNQDLGSDQWFNWQYKLLNDEPQSPDLVAKTFPGLLEVQGTLFALSKMHPPEPELPDFMGKIQALQVTTVVLTSRGFNYRDASERALASNGYELAKTALKIDEQRGLFMPFDPAQPNAHGLNQAIIDRIKPSLRQVTYSNGIYMTAGQHKGYMLRTLLARAVPAKPGDAKPTFKAIVFVDDHMKHTTSMHEAHEGMPLDVITFRYSREDGNVDNFADSSKHHVIEDWERLRNFVDGVLVK